MGSPSIEPQVIIGLCSISLFGVYLIILKPFIIGVGASIRDSGTYPLLIAIISPSS